MAVTPCTCGRTVATAPINDMVGNRIPLMPALFSLGLHAPLALQPDERVMAFLDDVYVTAQPPHVSGLRGRLGHLLATSVGIRWR